MGNYFGFGTKHKSRAILNNRVIYYYQTLVGLPTVALNCTHIHLASLHCDTDNGVPVIHLNNTNIFDPMYDKLWKQLQFQSSQGIKIILMLGGAGGAFTKLFENYEVYYPLLKQALSYQPFFSGVDFDIEEYVNLDDCRKLIRNIRNDFGADFTIALAPLQNDLSQDGPGMSGFSYKQLYTSPEGSMIEYFNAQCYGEWDENTYQSMINNGYPASKVVMGMLSSQFNQTTESSMLDCVKSLKQQYPDFGGVFDWEYFDAYPSPEEWGKLFS